MVARFVLGQQVVVTDHIQAKGEDLFLKVATVIQVEENNRFGKEYPNWYGLEVNKSDKHYWMVPEQSLVEVEG